MLRLISPFVILLIGYIVYGKLTEKIFGPDDRLTPAIAINDGVDCVPMSKWKAFLYGSASGVVEPIMGLIGIWLSTSLSKLMPWFLSFSAGAMLFVVAEELLPDAKNAYPSKISTWGFIAGFILMMILDVVLS